MRVQCVHAYMYKQMFVCVFHTCKIILYNLTWPSRLVFTRNQSGNLTKSIWVFSRIYLHWADLTWEFTWLNLNETEELHNSAKSNEHAD